MTNAAIPIIAPRVFGDAINRMPDKARHIAHDHSREQRHDADNQRRGQVEQAEAPENGLVVLPNIHVALDFLSGVGGADESGWGGGSIIPISVGADGAGSLRGRS